MGATLAEIDDRISALAERVSRLEGAVSAVGATVAHNREASDDRHREAMAALGDVRGTLQATTDRLFGMIERREAEAAQASAEIRGAILKSAAGVVGIIAALVTGGWSLTQCPVALAPVAQSAPAPAPVTP